MQVGDKVRVKEHIPVFGGKTGCIFEPGDATGLWWVDLDEPLVDCDTTDFYESELEPLNVEDASVSEDLTGKTVRITRGYWTDTLGVVVNLDEFGQWLVQSVKWSSPLSFARDKLEVVPDKPQPTQGVLVFDFADGTTKSVGVSDIKVYPASPTQPKPRKFTSKELLDAAQGDMAPAANAVEFTYDMWMILLAQPDRKVRWNERRLEVVR